MTSFGPLIYAYTVRDAVEDGTFLDAQLPDLGLAEVSWQHYKTPLYLTQGVADLIRHAVEHCGRDWRGVWHDILTVSRTLYTQPTPNRREFTVLVADTPTTHAAVTIHAACQPYDTTDPKPVVVFFLPHED